MSMQTGKRTQGRAALLEAMESRTLMSYTPAGPEFLVNTHYRETYVAQSSKAVATDGQGNFTTVWSSQAAGIFARRFDAQGRPAAGEFQVNTSGPTTAPPGIAMRDDGSSLVVWEAEIDPKTKGEVRKSVGIYAQRLGATGARVGGEFRVNTFLTGGQYSPDVAVDGAGNFVVVWQSAGNQDGSYYGVYGQRYDAGGRPLGAEFRINTQTLGSQMHPSVAVSSGGQFIVAWDSDGQDGSGYGVYAQRFDAAGARVGGEFRVNDYTLDNQWYPQIGAGDGSFTIAWRSIGQDGQEIGAHAKRYALLADGAASAGPEFPVSTLAGNHVPYQVAYDRQDGSIITTHSSPGSGVPMDCFAQEYDPAGSPVGSRVVLNAVTQGAQTSPKVAFQPNGDFVTAFTSRPTSSGIQDIFARRFVRDVAPPTATPVAGPATFSDTAVNAPASQDSPATEVDSITTQVLG